MVPVTAEEAVRSITSGQRVYIHGIAAAPQILIDAMTERAEELRNAHRRSRALHKP